MLKLGNANDFYNTQSLKKIQNKHEKRKIQNIQALKNGTKHFKKFSCPTETNPQVQKTIKSVAKIDKKSHLFYDISMKTGRTGGSTESRTYTVLGLNSKTNPTKLIVKPLSALGGHTISVSLKKINTMTRAKRITPICDWLNSDGESQERWIVQLTTKKKESLVGAFEVRPNMVASNGRHGSQVFFPMHVMLQTHPHLSSPRRIIPIDEIFKVKKLDPEQEKRIQVQVANATPLPAAIHGIVDEYLLIIPTVWKKTFEQQKTK